jgi:hypothetical protein
MVINRSVVKLVVALSIPLGMTWLFIYAQQLANTEVKDFKKIQAVNPTADRVTISNYEMKEVDDKNDLRWQLVAKSGSLDPTTQNVALKDVKVKYFKDGQISMFLQAPLGEANESTRFVKLTGIEGQKVIAEGDGGKNKLIASAIELTKKNQFKATGGVNIEVIGVAKVTGDMAEGSMNISKMSGFRVVGNTHAIVGI